MVPQRREERVRENARACRVTSRYGTDLTYDVTGRIFIPPLVPPDYDFYKVINISRKQGANLFFYLFSEQERPRAIAVWSVASGISVALGPIVGGWLLDHYFWGSIFLFNVPFIVAAILAVVWLVPESRDPRPERGRSDPAGVLLAAGGLTSLVYAIIEQPTRGWDWVTLTTLTVGLALLAAFAACEARSRHPVLKPTPRSCPGWTGQC